MATEVTEDFTLLSVALVTVDNYQYPTNAQHLGMHKAGRAVESIPWGELLGRRITSVCMQDDHLILGLSTKR